MYVNMYEHYVSHVCRSYARIYANFACRWSARDKWLTLTCIRNSFFSRFSLPRRQRQLQPVERCHYCWQVGRELRVSVVLLLFLFYFLFWHKLLWRSTAFGSQVSAKSNSMKYERVNCWDQLCCESFLAKQTVRRVRFFHFSALCFRFRFVYFLHRVCTVCVRAGFEGQLHKIHVFFSRCFAEENIKITVYKNLNFN